jgi:EAL and modified HD-GYP domain-containing signal transduction protein
MATQVLSVARSEDAVASAFRYVARQPILDLHCKVHGYELLFRSGPEPAFRGDGDFATRTMIDNSVMFGLEKLTGGLPAFVNCTAEALIKEQVGLLPPSMTILEILETVEPDEALISACRHLKSLGFRLALDDFVWKPSLEPLIQIADYIKIDFILSGKTERGEMLARLNGTPLALIAEKVETQEEYERARTEGFKLFQGYYFCRPILLTKSTVPANKLSHLELLRLLQETTLNLKKLSELVKRDASLTYRLLRLVNSPASAVRQEVRSIQAALIAVGDDIFRRIATLAITSELNGDQPAEILRMAFIRARFCEIGARLCGLNALEQYLLGMFSMLPAMLRCSMEEVTSALPLRETIWKALLGEPNHERSLLTWLEANEQGEWARCDGVAAAISVEGSGLHQCFTNAVLWAEEILPAAVSRPRGRARV